MSNVNIIVTVANRAITVLFPVAIPATAKSILDNLDEYDSDESAATGGVAIGEYYIGASNHVSFPGTVIKRQ